jgi:hypothetical protein
MTEEPAQLFLVNVRKMTQRKFFDVSRNVLEAKRLQIRRMVPTPRVRVSLTCCAPRTNALEPHDHTHTGDHALLPKPGEL